MKNIFYLLFLLLLPSEVFAENKNLTPNSELAGKQHIYYINVFNYVMDNIKAGESFHWDAGTGKGDIKVGEEYVSKSKAICRDFTETFEINNQTGKSNGAACKRDNSKSWCRLKDEDAHTCALEEPEGMTDKIIDGVENTLGKGNEMIRNTKDWWNR